MEFTRFGSTGLYVSRLCLGTGTFGKQSDEKESVRILDTSAASGVNFIDCADIYPPGDGTEKLAGTAELILGRWLKNKRDLFIVTSKAGGSMGPAAWDKGTSRKHLLDAIDNSLKRLDTDYVDLYQIHMEDLNTPIDETVDAMDTIVRSGKARYIGVSNFLAYRLAKSLGRQDFLRLTRYVSVQPRYNLLFREIERELLPLAMEENLAVMPYNPLAGGLLSGKYKRDEQPAQGRFSTKEFGQFGAMYQSRYWNENKFETISALEKLAQENDTTIATLSISWLLENPAITSVNLGASRAEQLTQTLAATEFKMDSGLKDRLDDLTGIYRRGDEGK